MPARFEPNVAADGGHRRKIEPPTERQLDRSSGELDIKLPIEYRRFVLALNGGIPLPGWIKIKAKRGIHEVEIGEFLSWCRHAGAWLSSVVEQTKRFRANHKLPQRYIVIAWVNSPGASVPLLLSTGGGDAGRMVVWAGGTTDAPFRTDRAFGTVAASFADLLESLDYPLSAKPWMPHIDRDDRAGVKRWIAAVADLDACDSASGLSPIQFAASRGRSDIVEMLLAAGAKPHGAFFQAVCAGRRPLAKAILARGVSAKELRDTRKRMDALAPDSDLDAMLEAALAKQSRPRHRAG